MSGNQFIPKFESTIHKEKTEKVQVKGDSTTNFLLQLSQYLILFLFGAVPLFFIPGLWASLGFQKVILSITVASLVAGLTCFMALRKVRAKTIAPISLGVFWLVVLAAFVSAFSAGDTLDSIRGSGFEVQTAGFLAVIAAVMTVTLVIQNSKSITIKAISIFTLSSSLLLIYSLLRIIIGADFLSFASFASVSVSPIGGINDLGILAGMLIMTGLITMVLLPIRSWLKAMISMIILVALIFLSIINFFSIWLVVGFFSLLLFIYLLTRDTLFKSDSVEKESTDSRLVIGITALVCVVSVIFIVAGDYASKVTNNIVSVDYATVVPSIEGTLGIARAVYEENALLGIGPNRFADAWRLYKDPSINETIFWDTDFNTGSGFVPTLFINLGLIGGLLLVTFHIWFLYLGYRLLLRNAINDPYWYYVGAVSFVCSVFVWGMTYVYEPGAAILIVAALFTGLTFVAAGALLPNMTKTIPLVINRQRGFFLMAVVIVLISNVVTILFSVGKQYVAQASFSKAQATAESIEAFNVVATDAFILYPDDRFVNLQAQIKLADLNSLLSIAEPTEDDQQRFLSTVEQAQLLVDQALSQDITNPANHAVLAGVYSSLAVAGINGAEQRAVMALNEAKRYDPINPGYYLIAAQMAVRIDDVELARNEISESLRLKPNYTEALFLSAQIDIKEGNTESAIATTKSIITLEPRNPTRYFQLGMLLSSSGKYKEAISAFESAVRLDSQYANARYLLALAYLSTDREEEALEQLQFVALSNPDNQQLMNLIQQIETGDIDVVPELGFEAPFNERAPIENNVDTETGRRSEETNLISPVNSISENNEEIEFTDSPQSNSVQTASGTESEVVE